MKIRLFASPIVAAFFVLNCWAQNAPASAPPPNSFLDHLTSLTDSDSRPWTAEQFATMGRIRDAAMTDPNAYNMLAHLTDNIGPRLSGSLQAQAAVEWVAAKMREMGTSVTLEKTTVPHWVRGKEDAVLTRWPGMPPGTTQKIVVTALGNSAPTSEDGLTANVMVVGSFAELRSLPVGEVKGKIVLFNKPFEEFGVSGATTYLQEHSSELTYHIAALESDLGCDHPTGLSFFGAPEAARYLAPVANALAPIGASVLTRSDEVTAEDIAGMVQARRSRSQSLAGFAVLL